MEKKARQFGARAVSLFLALLMLVTTAGIVPTASAAAANVESPVIVKNADGTYNVTFNYESDWESMEVFGNFPASNWSQALPMEKVEGNVFTATLNSTVGGSYEYKFHVPNTNDWFGDPKNPLKADKDDNGLLVLDEKPVIKDNGDGTYNVTLRYADTEGKANTVEVMGGGLPGATWDPGASVKMERTASGSNIWWKTFENVQPGEYKYKFVINGTNDGDSGNDTWVADPNVSETDSDGNSIIELDSPEVEPPVEGDPPVEMDPNETWLQVKLHYHRSDNNYSGWDAFFWDVGNKHGYGGRDFEEEENGVVATLDVLVGTTKIGYLVRKGGDAWTSKDVDADRFVDLSKYASGVVHIDVESGVEAYTVRDDEAVKGTPPVAKEPETTSLPEGIVQIKIHYHRDDNNYEGWNIYHWEVGGRDKLTAQFTETDENGDKVAVLGIMAGISKVGYIVRHSTSGNDWAGKDTDNDRFVDLSNVLSGTVHVYVKSGEEAVEIKYDEAVTYNPDTDVAVMFHYDRTDKNYDDWDIHLWDANDSSKSYTHGVFTGTDNAGRAVASVILQEGTVKLGFIVRKGGDSWAKKDVDADQFVTVPEMRSGLVHIYIESGVKGYTKEYGSNANYEHKPIEVSYKDGIIDFLVTGKLEPAPKPEDFQVAPSGVTITAVEDKGPGENSTYQYALTLSGTLDPYLNYVLEYNGLEYSIKMPIFNRYFKFVLWYKQASLNTNVRSFYL